MVTKGTGLFEIEHHLVRVLDVIFFYRIFDLGISIKGLKLVSCNPLHIN